MDAPIQFADCNSGTVVLYNNEMRNRFSPNLTTCVLTHEEGGPQGMTVTVGTGGTYKTYPAVMVVLVKQLPTLRLSAVVLYRSAIEYSVSFTPAVMRTHPLGGVQDVGCAIVVVGKGVTVGRSVGMFCVGRGEANSTANVVGVGNDVGVRAGTEVSASESEMPPITSKREIAPMINPLPNCRRAFMITSPAPVYPWR